MPRRWQRQPAPTAKTTRLRRNWFLMHVNTQHLCSSTQPYSTIELLLLLLLLSYGDLVLLFLHDGATGAEPAPLPSLLLHSRCRAYSECE
jgi:hypothetical protein